MAAAVLALLSLVLAAYAVHHVLTTHQDVWLSYPAANPGGAPAVLGAPALVVALALLTPLVVPGLPGHLRALAARYRPNLITNCPAYGGSEVALPSFW